MPRAVLLLIALAVVACGGVSVDPPESSQGPAGGPSAVSASVEFLTLEGGCWTLQVGEDLHYLPLNLPEEFRRDGLKVSVELRRRDDYASVCQVGPVVEVLSIRRR